MTGLVPLTAERSFSELSPGFSDAVAMNDGTIALIEQGNDDGDVTSVSLRFLDADGMPTSDPIVVNETTAFQQNNPTATLLANGNLLIVWEGFVNEALTTYHFDIFGRIVAPDGSFVTSEFRVNAPDPGTQLQPDVAALPGGGAVVSWASVPVTGVGGTFDVYTARISNAGVVSGEQELAAATDAWEDSPELVGLPGGFGAFWIWAPNDRSPSQIVYGAPGGGTVTVSTTDHLSVGDPQAAVLADGNIVVVWETTFGPDGGGALADSNLLARVLRPDGTFVTDEIGVDDSFRTATYGQVLALPDGGFLASYYDIFATPRGPSAFAQRYDPDFAPIGDNILMAGTEGSGSNLHSAPFFVLDRDDRPVGLWLDQRDYESVVYAAQTWGTARSDTLTGTDSADTIFGQGKGDTIAGRNGNDLLDGGAGNDALNGGKGSDRMSGGAGDDTLDGAGGKDRLDGGGGDDRLSGGSKSDRLGGGGGDDTLRGGGGSDTLDGGGGKDEVSGDAGADVFVFSRKGGTTTIADFTDADTIALDTALWSGKLTKAEVVARFADDSSGDTVFRFDGGEKLVVAGVADAGSLVDDISFA